MAAGAYLEVSLGRDYSFTSNVAARLLEVGNNLTGATLYFMAKSEPSDDANSQAVIAVTPSANNVTNIVTVSMSSANTNLGQVYPLLFWELSMTSANSKTYTLDQGRMAITQPVRTV